MIKYNTIDLDYCNKEKLYRIMAKISLCNGLHNGTVKDSMSKGYHLKLRCLWDCDLCRFVFDDPTRYTIDFRRPNKYANVLFSSLILTKPTQRDNTCPPQI